MRFAAAVLVSALMFLAGAKLAAAEDAAVALPPFLVEEMAKGPPWRYGEAMGYEILSRCSDATTRRVVEAHHQLHVLLAEVLPPQLQLELSVPRALILYDQELQPAASQEVIAQLLRNTPADAENDYVPPAITGRGLRIAPPVTPARRYSFLPNLRLWDRDALMVFMIVRREDFDSSRLALTQDYVSFLLKSRLPALPLWFQGGFMALYVQMHYGGNELTLPPLEWISERHSASVKKEPKTAPPVQPLAEFLAGILPVPPPLADYDAKKAWQAQAMLFARWGLDGGDHAQRTAFWKFAERAAVEGTSEKLFQECFGFDYATADARLAAYLPNAVRRSVTFKPAQAKKLPPLVLQNASVSQIARLKGDWERLEISYVKLSHPQLAPKYLEQARRTLRRAYDRDERDPRLLAVMGLCEVDAANDAGARELLESAAAIGPIRPRANYELARLRFATQRAAPEGKDGLLSVSQAAEILKPLFAARAEQPPLHEVYELITETWAATDATPTRRHLAVLDEGVRLFPRRTAFVLRVAELNLRFGFRVEANELAEIAARTADESMRAQVATFRQRLSTP